MLPNDLSLSLCILTHIDISLRKDIGNLLLVCKDWNKAVTRGFTPYHRYLQAKTHPRECVVVELYEDFTGMRVIVEFDVVMEAIEGNVADMWLGFRGRTLWVEGSRGCKVPKKRLREIEKEEGLVLVYID